MKFVLRLRGYHIFMNLTYIDLQTNFQEGYCHFKHQNLK